MDTQSLVEYLLAKPEAIEDYPFGPDVSVFKVKDKINGYFKEVKIDIITKLSTDMVKYILCTQPYFYRVTIAISYTVFCFFRKIHRDIFKTDKDLMPDDIHLTLFYSNVVGFSFQEIPLTPLALTHSLTLRNKVFCILNWHIWQDTMT